MAVRERALTRTGQPQGLLRLREGPFATNSIVWTASNPHTDIGPRNATPIYNGAAAPMVGTDGPAVRHTTTNGSDSIVFAAPAGAENGFSVVLRFMLESSSATTLFNSLNEATTLGAIQIRTNGANLQFVSRDSAVRFSSAGVPLVVGRWHTVAFRCGVFPTAEAGRLSGRMWIDGVYVGTYDSTTTFSLVKGDFAIACGRYASDVAQSRPHQISLAAIAFDSAPDEFLQWASANPYEALFQPDDTPVFYSLGGGSGQTVSVPSGSLTLTGQTPTVVATANQSIVVPAGSLTLSGLTPVVTVGDAKTVAVPEASLTLSGLTPTVTATDNKTVEVPAAALALSGQTPTVFASDFKLVAVPAASLSLTAYAPTVVSDGSQIVQVPKASLNLTAYAPTVSALAPILVSVPVASLTLSGLVPTVVTPVTVAVSKATLNLTAFAPTVQAGSAVAVSVPVASLNLYAYAPEVFGDIVRTGGGGSRASNKKKKKRKARAVTPELQLYDVVEEAKEVTPVLESLADVKQQLSEQLAELKQEVVEVTETVEEAVEVNKLDEIHQMMTAMVSQLTTQTLEIQSLKKQIRDLEEVVILVVNS